MAAGGRSGKKKIWEESARARTRKLKQRSSKGVFSKILLILLIGGLAYVYEAIQPPLPKICGSADGPPVTAPRIKLRDGRNLAYKEHGVPRDEAVHKIVFVHGFDCCRHDAVVADELTRDLFRELELYIVSFDRPGYGESDPNLKGDEKSIALDIEELADKLALGSKFYVIGFSLGGELVWSCLKYIPHRLEGATLLAPTVHYWWSGLPANLTKEVYSEQFPQDQWALSVGRYAPWLVYWWNTQKWFPSSSVMAGHPDIFSRRDKEIFHKFAPRLKYAAQVRQQGDYVSVHCDLISATRSWNFSPLELQDPFPGKNGSVHIWQGDEDILVPAKLQRYVAKQLPWVTYHELPGRGHMFPHEDGMSEAIVKTLLFGAK